ncbi:MAG: phosphoribosylamine--glycine ligase, partial [Anaerohalosphaera sp.]|nr:phosphoribosylamine--glycine ligase [Anaerohalosphaera sp.]
MNVLLIGGGGREHAIAWKLAGSTKLDKLFIAPGNPGTAAYGENVDISVDDIDGLVEFAKKADVGLAIVGPEDPLAA